jgi:hypothetical protein
MALLIAIVAVLLLIWLVSYQAGRVLRERSLVSTPTRRAYQVEVGPSGVPWFGIWDGSWLFAPAYWARYLNHRPLSWNVVATETWTGREALRLDFDSRRDALVHYAETVRMIEQGQPVTPDIDRP